MGQRGASGSVSFLFCFFVFYLFVYTFVFSDHHFSKKKISLPQIPAIPRTRSARPPVARPPPSRDAGPASQGFLGPSGALLGGRGVSGRGRAPRGRRRVPGAGGPFDPHPRAGIRVAGAAGARRVLPPRRECAERGARAGTEEGGLRRRRRRRRVEAGGGSDYWQEKNINAVESRLFHLVFFFLGVVVGSRRAPPLEAHGRDRRVEAPGAARAGGPRGRKGGRRRRRRGRRGRARRRRSRDGRVLKVVFSFCIKSVT